MNPILVPAAQYLRMSTEHQQYSLQNQSERVKQYAEEHGFEVIQTYSDAAKSGLVLRNRKGLQQLLKDVVTGAAPYRAILVYDVSRWGRFQDTDESAHYEFLCKSAGIPVHYCAEIFANDGTLPSLIMKALKRTMAGEFSRELGVKVLTGQKRFVERGFKPGGLPGYGLRRLLVSPDGTPKQALVRGERKSLATDRVILVPGPADEVACVREIYRMLIHEGRQPSSIARELNRRNIPKGSQPKWDFAAVHNILTHPKYTGDSLYGRTSGRLHTRRINLPRAAWTVVADAFTPIVSRETFLAAQAILRMHTTARSDEGLLASLKTVYRKEGRITHEMLRKSTDLPSPSTIRDHFGGLTAAYQMIGYQNNWPPERFDRYRRLRVLREELLKQIVDLAAEPVAIESRNGNWRKHLRLQCGRLIPIVVCRCIRLGSGCLRWIATYRPNESRQLVLLARTTIGLEGFKDYFVVPDLGTVKTTLKEDDPRLRRGTKLNDLSQLHYAVARFTRR